MKGLTMNITYETLMSKITELTKQAEALRANEGEKHMVIEDIKFKMEQFGINVSDLQMNQEKVVHRRRKPEAKYMDKETGAIWTGRGKTPLWMKQALAQGKTKEQFAVA
jgi:DNA-binding protein H-NS